MSQTHPPPEMPLLSMVSSQRRAPVWSAAAILTKAACVQSPFGAESRISMAACRSASAAGCSISSSPVLDISSRASGPRPPTARPRRFEHRLPGAGEPAHTARRQGRCEMRLRRKRSTPRSSTAERSAPRRASAGTGPGWSRSGESNRWSYSAPSSGNEPCAVTWTTAERLIARAGNVASREEVVWRRDRSLPTTPQLAPSPQATLAAVAALRSRPADLRRLKPSPGG